MNEPLRSSGANDGCVDRRGRLARQELTWPLQGLARLAVVDTIASGTPYRVVMGIDEPSTVTWPLTPGCEIPSRNPKCSMSPGSRLPSSR